MAAVAASQLAREKRSSRTLQRIACLVYATAMASLEDQATPWSALGEAERQPWLDRVQLAARGDFGPIMQWHGPDSPGRPW